MYEWTFCIEFYTFIGRKWEEFINLLDRLQTLFNLDYEKNLIIYVHNLSYEFQFIRKRLKWEHTFSLKERKIISALCDKGIEFRCSYLLSGYSLAKLSDQLLKYKVKKKSGDLDYSKKRGYVTPLTKNEIQYCINDCLVVVSYIKEYIERNGDISKIPLTKTGAVRKYCRDMCLYENGKHKNNDYYQEYHSLMKKLTLTKDEYYQCRRVFAGGFTHANPMYMGMKIEDVKSYDFASSYPYVMISEKFPMSKPELIDIQSIGQFYDNLELYCCMFDVHFINIKSKYYFENYISKSHCWDIENAIVNNGRIFSADSLYTSLTEQDYYIIKNMYEWDEIEIFNFRRFVKGYLPTNFVKSILKLFVDKTKLKGVQHKEVEYLVSKENLN